MVASARNDQVCIDIPAHYLSSVDDAEFAKKTTLGCLDSRIRDNLFRVFAAGGLSFAGAVLAGLVPTTWGIIGGAALSGIGNGASTYLAWEKDNKKLIEARYLRDLPALMTSVDATEQKLARLIERVQAVQEVIIEAEGERASTALGEERPVHSACFRYRAQRNLIRILTAGGLSAVGGWLGGFVTSATGVTFGGILGGIGNGLSTWLAFEKKNEEAIREHALNTLPQLFAIAEEADLKLVALIERIKEIHPEIIMDFSDIEGPQNEIEQDPHAFAKRIAKNTTYVNIAGWLSAVGGLIAGFAPNTAGILVGGVTGGAANSISTWLAWEGPNDKAVERTEVEVFQASVLKIVSLAAKIQTLQEIVDPEPESSSYSS